MKGLDPVIEALQLWQLESACSGHLDADEIYRLAEDAGLNAATDEEMNHLSDCSLCLAEWSAWRQAISVADESVHYAEPAAQSPASYGFLQAAASAERRPFALTSSCGKFSVDVMPLVDDPAKVMMVFKTCDGGSSDFENQIARLRDRNGNIFLSGCIQNGQFARNVDNLERFDLTTWTLIFTQGDC
ncbi:MAG: hypothetical protein L3J63_02445 [Geopsychrobacter sp.]|nr:hypothetical protein [Geopsychrobacter sp.]